MTNSVWDPEGLWGKAVSYTDLALSESRDSAMFPFLASLALEFLGRSVLADKHQVLLADPGDPENVFYAFGVGRSATPFSIQAKTVYLRLERFVSGFTEEMVTFCISLANRRNEEIHTAGVPFAVMDSSEWLPKLYRVFAVLCAARGKELRDLLGPDETAVAKSLVAEADREIRDSVLEKMGRAEHSAASIPEADRGSMVDAFDWAEFGTKNAWQEFTCPACRATGRMFGVLTHTLAPRLENEQLIEEEIYVRDSFACPLCGVVLSGHLELDAAGIAGSFSRETSTDPDEYYGEIYLERMEASYADADYGYGND